MGSKAHVAVFGKPPGWDVFAWIFGDEVMQLNGDEAASAPAGTFGRIPRKNGQWPE